MLVQAHDQLVVGQLGNNKFELVWVEHNMVAPGCAVISRLGINLSRCRLQVIVTICSQCSKVQTHMQDMLLVMTPMMHIDIVVTFCDIIVLEQIPDTDSCLVEWLQGGRHKTGCCPCEGGTPYNDKNLLNIKTDQMTRITYHVFLNKELDRGI